jgi:hypothetical protein
MILVMVVYGLQDDSIYAGCLGGELVLLNAANGQAIESQATPDQEPSIVMATLSESRPAAVGHR